MTTVKYYYVFYHTIKVYSRTLITGATRKTPEGIYLREFCGAGGGGRTRTVLPPMDFESTSSANSNTPAYSLLFIIFFIISHPNRFCKCFFIISIFLKRIPWHKVSFSKSYQLKIKARFRKPDRGHGHFQRNLFP